MVWKYLLKLMPGAIMLAALVLYVMLVPTLGLDVSKWSDRFAEMQAQAAKKQADECRAFLRKN